MSPNRYEVVLLEPLVKKCHGCGIALWERFRNLPFNVILKHVYRRITAKNDTGQFLYCSDYSNIYHLTVNHVKKKNPLFTGLVYVSVALYTSLDDGKLNTSTEPVWIKRCCSIKRYSVTPHCNYNFIFID